MQVGVHYVRLFEVLGHNTAIPPHHGREEQKACYYEFGCDAGIDIVERGMEVFVNSEPEVDEMWIYWESDTDTAGCDACQLLSADWGLEHDVVNDEDEYWSRVEDGVDNRQFQNEYWAGHYKPMKNHDTVSHVETQEVLLEVHFHIVRSQQQVGDQYHDDSSSNAHVEDIDPGIATSEHDGEHPAVGPEAGAEVGSIVFSDEVNNFVYSKHQKQSVG